MEQIEGVLDEKEEEWDGGDVIDGRGGVDENWNLKVDENIERPKMKSTKFVMIVWLDVGHNGGLEEWYETESEIGCGKRTTVWNIQLGTKNILEVKKNWTKFERDVKWNRIEIWKK